jgi:hypothetical protein
MFRSLDAIILKGPILLKNGQKNYGFSVLTVSGAGKSKAIWDTCHVKKERNRPPYDCSQWVESQSKTFFFTFGDFLLSIQPTNCAVMVEVILALNSFSA